MWKKVWRFVRRWWWAFLMVAAAVAGAVAAAILKPGETNIEASPGQPPAKTFKERAQEQVERVRLEGEIERARVQAKAQAQQEQLDEIEQIGENDPAEGRRRLASFLQGTL